MFGKIKTNMDAQKLVTSQNLGKWALWMSRVLSPQSGKKVVGWLSNWIVSQRQLPLVEAVRCNQWVANGENVSATYLDQQVKKVFYQAGLSFYNLFHFLDSPRQLEELVVFSPEIEAVIQNSREQKKGLIVTGIHMSNFDLVAQAASYHGLQAFALSLPQPDAAIRWQHDLRRKSGLEILDATLPNLKLAIKRLESGETMLTGLDRPVDDPKMKPIFFGRPAHLAVHHVQLALRVNVPVVVMGAVLQEDDRYHIYSSEEITMQTFSDRQIELKANAEHLLESAQEIIRKAVDQWVVFQPVWPEVLPLVPR